MVLAAVADLPPGVSQGQESRFVGPAGHAPARTEVQQPSPPRYGCRGGGCRADFGRPAAAPVAAIAGKPGESVAAGDRAGSQTIVALCLKSAAISRTDFRLGERNGGAGLRQEECVVDFVRHGIAAGDKKQCGQYEGADTRMTRRLTPAARRTFQLSTLGSQPSRHPITLPQNRSCCGKPSNCE